MHPLKSVKTFKSQWYNNQDTVFIILHPLESVETSAQ
jgi:hypothetical protein